MTAVSEAAERNKEPIRQVLSEWLPGTGRVLEIGSGTGQHAVYFARHFPGLHWITSDLPTNHQLIRRALEQAGLANLSGPLSLDVAGTAWPRTPVDVVYTANTCHIMGWDEVRAMFRQVSALLAPGGRFVVYGPFNRNGDFTSPSNRAFDASLRARNPLMGIRDLEALEAHAGELVLEERRDMPANNMMLCWSRSRMND